ncbi:MAG: hypothetical protein R6T87_04455, partial [Marinobacter sp.]
IRCELYGSQSKVAAVNGRKQDRQSRIFIIKGIGSLFIDPLTILAPHMPPIPNPRIAVDTAKNTKWYDKIIENNLVKLISNTINEKETIKINSHKLKRPLLPLAASKFISILNKNK